MALKHRTLLRYILTMMAGAGLLALTSQSALACATCGCTLSTDAATGFSTRAGWRLNLQYDYIDQDQLRHGSSTAAKVPDGHEFEYETKNQYITASLAYAPSARWNLSLQVPYVIRDHSTYGNYNSTAPLPALTTSHSSSLGDVRLIGSYQGFLPTHNLGVQFGIKFASGAYGDAVHFNHGPAAGDALDTSLQPGTGSTDVILGAYYYQALSQDFDGAVHVNYQFAVRSRFDYRPGNQINLSAGLRYMALTSWVPQLQLNIAHRDRDSGVNADVDNSEGTFMYLSPGISYLSGKDTQLYGLVQLPIYHQLDGWQLAPRWTATLGLSYRF